MSSHSHTAMEVVQIISTEVIKPSATTPPSKNLKSFKLGAPLDDQSMLLSVASLYVPLTLFYPAKLRASFHVGLERAQALKRSLAQTLTRFYPLAGKIRSGDDDDGGVRVDCDNSGVCYVEARVKCHLSRFLKRPDYSVLDTFLPAEDGEKGLDQFSLHVAKIQLNIFECGGIAVSVLVSHFENDGVVSLSGFLRDWAGSTRGFCDQAFRLDFSPDELNPMPMKFLNKGKAVTRRLIFDSEAIDSLKAITMSSRVQNPTTMEAVSSLIWKCTMESLRTNSGRGSSSCAFVLSTRSRRAVATLCRDESKTELDDLAHRLRGAIRKGTNSCVEYESGDLDYLGCYGWCNGGLYEVDFGWGRPAWVTSSGSSVHKSVFLNSIVLVETRWGNGVEAWVTLDENSMANLVHDQELLTFASTSPQGQIRWRVQ